MSKKISVEISPEGKIIYHQDLTEAILTFRDAAKRIVLSLVVDKVRRRRSNDANEYYMGVVVEMITECLNEMGWESDKATTHEFLKIKFNSVQKTLPDGSVEMAPMPTRTMDSKSFWEYVEKCRSWAAQTLEINIPDPNEDGTIDYKKNNQ